ncbi:hypothetical protein MtrunA17_Chr7g0215031 [Medicago truncatula]|nr:hypothetical protein MtrunA17_Chr7g0215031 [Medicago truncatula]
MAVPWKHDAPSYKDVKVNNLLIAVKILWLMFVGNTGSLVDHVVQHSSVDNMIPPPALETTSDHSQRDTPKTASDSDAQKEMIITASDAHQLTAKGNYCALCKKVHD